MRVIFYCDINMFCFCLLCVEFILLYIYIYKRDRGEENIYKKEYVYYLLMLFVII